MAKEEAAEQQDPFGGDELLPLPGKGTDAGEKLQRAHDAFVRGDYAEVRALTAELSNGSGDVRIAAETLRRRVSVDPMQLAVLGACTLFFLFIVWKYVL